MPLRKISSLVYSNDKSEEYKRFDWLIDGVRIPCFHCFHCFTRVHYEAVLTIGGLVSKSSNRGNPKRIMKKH